MPWTLQEAKNRLSEVVVRAECGEPQLVTRNGRAAVYVVDAEAFEAIRKTPTTTKTMLDHLVSVITIGEIERGADQVRRRDPAFASALESWIEELVVTLSGSILPFSLTAARHWGRLSSKTGRKDIDLMIAATAIEHGLRIATRNTQHFAGLGVDTFDPFAA
jgi:prevent-host-death family protein